VRISTDYEKWVQEQIRSSQCPLPEDPEDRRDEFMEPYFGNLILKGGSHYQPQGSHWYFPQAYKVNEHGKFLLIAPGKDRSGAVGFRCVVDAV
jgi:hypothetical protein